MQLHRLYWVPAGFPATDGAYVRQPAEELLAVLCLESARHGTAIVGENLGTVPAETGEAIRRHGLLGLYVLQYELHSDREPAPPPLASVAGLNTHNMPTFRGFCEGRDLDELAALGLLPEAGRLAGREERAALVRELRRQALPIPNAAAPPAPHSQAREAPEKDPEPEVPIADLLRRQLDWLADSPARWVLVNLEDLWGEGEPHNVPGTSSERPNWRRKAALTLEEIESDPAVAALLRELDLRRRAAEPSTEGS
jgi:4-alpha-glucanotransferase